MAGQIKLLWVALYLGDMMETGFSRNTSTFLEQFCNITFPMFSINNLFPTKYTNRLEENKVNILIYESDEVLIILFTVNPLTHLVPRLPLSIKAYSSTICNTLTAIVISSHSCS